jgi:hypothetical protein
MYKKLNRNWIADLVGLRRLTLNGLLIGLTSLPSHAAYNANMFGTIQAVLTYPGSTSVLFRLNNQPSTHPACNPYYFSIGDEIDAESRSRAYARLMLAYAMGENVNIGYDNAGTCAGGWIRAYRIG